MAPRAIEFVFFDIGGTLGDRDSTTGTFIPFPSSVPLLAATRDVLGLRIGILTTLGNMTNPQGLALLKDAGLAEFLDPHGFVSEHDTHVAKPDPAMYKAAAKTVGLPVEKCLFVGENLVEVMGALAAGMHALLKPSPPGRELSK